MPNTTYSTYISPIRVRLCYTVIKAQCVYAHIIKLKPSTDKTPITNYSTYLSHNNVHGTASGWSSIYTQAVLKI